MSAEIILASASPRRREILTTLGIPHRIVVSDADEALPAGLTPAEAVEMLAARKAAAVAPLVPADAVILAADTVVAVDGDILGKPRDAADAAAMLRQLSGRAHTVYTGVAVRRGAHALTAHEATEVRFAPLSEAEIAAYIATGEPADKAGAYAIQGRAARFIEGITGDYFNVVGLPAHRVCVMLEEMFSPALG